MRRQWAPLDLTVSRMSGGYTRKQFPRGERIASAVVSVVLLACDTRFCGKRICICAEWQGMHMALVKARTELRPTAKRRARVLGFTRTSPTGSWYGTTNYEARRAENLGKQAIRM
jgi:hypothetical protein